MKIKHERNRPIKRVAVQALANIHWHGRECGEIMNALITHSISGGADILAPMPNTIKPLISAELVTDYINKARDFCELWKLRLCLMPIVMLTENTTRDMLVSCIKAEIVDGKIYPYMRTTQSDHGIRRYGKILEVVKWCGELGVKVHGHFEHPNAIYIDRDCEYLCLPLVEMFLQETSATIIWEHGSDARCIPAWKQFAKTGKFFVTLTAHHLASNEDIASGDVRKRCRPLIKTERDRGDLVQLVAEDHSWVMAGPDDAAHDRNRKHVLKGQCSCGAFTSPFLHSLYAHALDELFETEKRTQTYINFTSRNARELHNLPQSSRFVTLVRTPFIIPDSYNVGSWIVEPYGAGETIAWSMEK